jgi:hypothetical protein
VARRLARRHPHWHRAAHRRLGAAVTRPAAVTAGSSSSTAAVWQAAAGLTSEAAGVVTAMRCVCCVACSWLFDTLDCCCCWALTSRACGDLQAVLSTCGTSHDDTHTHTGP